jgi:hypothetical protein
MPVPLKANPVTVDYQLDRFEADERRRKVKAPPEPSGALGVFVMALSTFLTLVTFYVVTEAPWPEQDAGQTVITGNRPVVALTLDHRHDNAPREARAEMASEMRR